MIRNGEEGTPKLGLTQALSGEISGGHEARLDSSAGLFLFFFSPFFPSFDLNIYFLALSLPLSVTF